jgi:hypothetical protein
MTTVYDVQAVWGDSKVDVREDYGDLMVFIEEVAMNEKYNCAIRLDYGNYFVLSGGKIGLSQHPQIHLIVEGKDTSQLEKWFELQIEDLKWFNEFEKYTFTKKVLNKSNLKLLKEHSNQMLLFKLKNKKRKYLTIERSNFERANVITMRPFRKKA